MLRFTIIFLALFVALPSHVAMGAQTQFSVEKGKKEWSFKVSWRDGNNKKHKVNYALPKKRIRKDLDTPIQYPKQDAAVAVVKKINHTFRGRKGPRVKATAYKSGAVGIRVSGGQSAQRKKFYEEAKQVRDKAHRTFLKRHGYILKKDRIIIPDFTEHVIHYSKDLHPLVEALGGPTKNPRKFANKALSFVQSIPYEKRALVANIYRRPLSILARNKGDCDSKTVLFLAIMHAAYPEMPLTLVRIPGHIYGGLGIEPKQGDVRLRRKGHTWVGVEPVGPAIRNVGGLGSKSKWRAWFNLYELYTVDETL